MLRRDGHLGDKKAFNVGASINDLIIIVKMISHTVAPSGFATDVFLNIYHYNSWNSWLEPIGCGLYHTSVEVKYHIDQPKRHLILVHRDEQHPPWAIHRQTSCWLRWSTAAFSSPYGHHKIRSLTSIRYCETTTVQVYKWSLSYFWEQLQQLLPVIHLSINWSPHSLIYFQIDFVPKLL